MSSVNEISLEVKIEEKDMYHFLLHCEYKRVISVIYIFFSISCLILFPFSLTWGDTTFSIMLLVVGLFYTFFTPLSLRLKAKRQILLNPAYKKPFNYVINETGLNISQDHNEFNYSWMDFTKIEQTKNALLFFFSKKVAFILPMKDCEKEIHNILEVLNKEVPHKLKGIKKIK
ncbi:YcxB-like protein [Natranaerovirga pectinivora]|uniref:YcxB-like protein n=1 Tax=Natranaerovirga pectinivora TaxID=682400 RepID=A0A4R3MIT1_9FIRM|nr:YcxB family protein [Natranaerovirga pectinivora]TCT13780.1 YcxB-like protein [Natranaerovirga pectinivora]